jgi:hypothetical protein
MNLSIWVDARRLDRRDFELAKALSDDVEAARKRGVAEYSIGLAREG